jgi:hypothetical protein
MEHEKRNAIPTPPLLQALTKSEEEDLSGNDQNCHQSPGHKTEKTLHHS